MRQFTKQWKQAILSNLEDAERNLRDVKVERHKYEFEKAQRAVSDAIQKVRAAATNDQR